MLGGKFPQVAELLEDAAEDVLAHLHFPMEHRPTAPSASDHGSTSSEPRPTKATSPPTLTVVTISGVPSGCTRNWLGRPV